MVESTSMNNRPPSWCGPAPSAHNRVRTSRDTASSWRTLPKVNDRSHDPIVDGARTRSNSTGVAPARNTSRSSMLSAPASIPPSTVATFAAVFAPHRPATATVDATRASRPIRWHNIAGADSPACDTRFGSSKQWPTRESS
jgi:hypothetical protein